MGEGGGPGWGGWQAGGGGGGAAWRVRTARQQTHTTDARPAPPPRTATCTRHAAPCAATRLRGGSHHRATAAAAGRATHSQPPPATHSHTHMTHTRACPRPPLPDSISTLRSANPVKKNTPPPPPAPSAHSPTCRRPGVCGVRPAAAGAPHRSVLVRLHGAWSTAAHTPQFRRRYCAHHPVDNTPPRPNRASNLRTVRSNFNIVSHPIIHTRGGLDLAACSPQQQTHPTARFKRSFRSGIGGGLQQSASSRGVVGAGVGAARVRWGAVLVS